MSVDTAKKLYEPATRAAYNGNLAQYLVDLHDARATFDFCGGMMFQLVLSDKLREHLSRVAKDPDGKQPVLFDSGVDRMMKMPGYKKENAADNAMVFHGREVREVPDAAGGMRFVLQLSFAGDGDSDGWSAGELDDYDGWGHDAGRTWRNGESLSFYRKFGPKAFGLHHRCYWHLDREDNLWLSAEDGCEGRLAEGPTRRRMFPF